MHSLMCFAVAMTTVSLAYLPCDVHTSSLARLPGINTLWWSIRNCIEGDGERAQSVQGELTGHMVLYIHKSYPGRQKVGEQ